MRRYGIGRASMLVEQLVFGSIVIVATVMFHVFGLILLSRQMRKMGASTLVADGRRVFVLVGIAVLAIIAIHTVELWLWAAIYLYIGEFSDLSSALYFSAVTATTLGYGDIVLSARWQLLGTFEAMGGLILFGASTAFLLALMRHMFDESR